MNRDRWWNNAVSKAGGGVSNTGDRDTGDRTTGKVGRLIEQTEREVYTDFINSRLGGAFCKFGQKGTSALPTDGTKRGRKLNDHGARRLICAVVEQAVVDYKLLVKRGRIVGGKVVPRKHSRCGWMRETESHAAELLFFFRPKGPMDQWLMAAGIDINPNLIREKLGL